MTPARRELLLAVLLSLVGSGLVVFAVRRGWGTLSPPQRLTIKAVSNSEPGSRIAADVQALGYLGIAGVLAIAATKRTGRVLVGALLAVAGLVVVVRVVVLLSDGIGHRFVATGDVAGRRVLSTSTAWPLTTLAGGVLLATAGLLVAVRGRRWAALSSAYETPAARVTAPVAPTDKSVWDALDRGDDPTA